MNNDNAMEILKKLVDSHKELGVVLDRVDIIENNQTIKLRLNDKTTAIISFENFEDYRDSRREDMENIIVQRVKDRAQFF